jgi:flagellar hook protein FlgE
MQSFYNGLNGMTNFSKSLDNVSNNISNMNTPGYKGNDVFVRTLGDGNNGYGTQLEDSSPRMQTGDLRQTGNDLDLAITGYGYFVLQNDNGELFYTRAGQFKFDENNKLVDSASGFKVMTIDDAGVLREMDVTNNKILPPVATTNVRMNGVLSLEATSATAPYVIENIGIFDATGKKNDVQMEFVKSATVANEWQVTIKNSADQTIGTFAIQFGTDGSPATGFNSISQNFTFNGVAQAVTFNFGDTGSLAGARQLSGSSTLGASATDGHDALGLRSFGFSEDGIMEFKYANGEERTGSQIALAYFNDPTKLHLSSNGLFTTQSTHMPTYGKPNQNLFGAIQGKSIELSNVDLTQEFADILIIQRGYQASSRIMSVSNDMLEQLYNNTRSR